MPYTGLETNVSRVVASTHGADRAVQDVASALLEVARAVDQLARDLDAIREQLANEAE